MTKQHRPSKAALPRRRSAGALSLQDPRHRHRVIPDKRRVSKTSRGALKPFGPALNALAGNTLCPKIGAAQWSCSKDECTCHLKDGILG